MNIADVVSDVVDLRRSGASLKGLCPFHREKTPSFFVSPEKGVFYCFGCGEGGDTITFLMKYRQLSYREAVLELCERFGVPVEYEAGSKQAREVGRLYEIHQVALDFYHGLLREGPKEVREYLEKRGVSQETVSLLKLGWGGRKRDALVKALSLKGFERAEIERSGLAVTSARGELLDRFHGRLIFPIRSPRGKVVAFAGRIIGAGEPKYLNSPETEIYHKKRILFGFDLAAKAMKEEGFAVIVEGYMDWIALWEKGIRNVVATCGTALTEEHLRLVKRVTPRVVLFFDGDRAGRKAAVRALEPSVRAGVRPLVLFPPRRMDPDDWVREEGPEKVKEMLRSAEMLMEYIVRAAARKFDVSTRRGRMEFVDFLEQFIRVVTDPAERRLYCEMVAEKASLPVETVERRYSAGNKKESPVEKEREDFGMFPVEEVLIGFLVAHREFISDPRVKEVAEGFEPPYRQVLELLSREGETSEDSGASITSGEKPEKIVSRSCFLYEKHFPVDTAENFERVLTLVSLRKREEEERKLRELLGEKRTEDRESILRRIWELRKEIIELRKNI